MWSLIFLIGFSGISGYCNSREMNPGGQEGKVSGIVQMETNLDSLVRSGRYVFVANSQTGPGFARQQVDPTYHFIKLDGPKGILQEGFDEYTPAGFGMSTIKGTIANYKVSIDKNLLYRITLDFRTGTTVFKFLLTVTEDNNVTAETDGHITMYGHLEAIDEAIIILLQNY
jgi:hypothetical protein